MQRNIMPAFMLLLASCAPAMAPHARLADAGSLSSVQSLAAPAAPWPDGEWWRAYGDPQLDRLIAEARQGSPNIATAMARLRAAEALAEQAGAAFGPTLTVDGAVTLDKQSYNNGIPPQFVPRGWNDGGRATIGGSLDLDIWGRQRAALAAATSEAEAARVDAAQAMLLLSATIAGAYADLAALHADRDILARAVEVRQSTFALTRDRVATGLGNRGEEKLAEARAAAAREDLAALDEALLLTRHRIAALVGAGPDRGLAIAPPRIAALHAFGLPERLGLDLVGRRPDIVSARLRAEAAASRISQARAAYYPNISLTALVGVQSLGLDQLLDKGSTIGSVGPAFSLPIFDRGRLNGQLHGAEARYDEAVAAYNSALIDAVRDAADAAGSIRALAVRRREAAVALDAAEDAYRIARLRYEGGLSTYLDVLTAEDAVLQRRRASADLDARAFTLDVSLARALGGGFTDPTRISSR